jgi:tRNA A37 threonylcarbamoyladenosine dehydratase
VGRHVVTVTTAATAVTPPLVKGQVVDLTAAQEAVLAASLRATTRRDATGEPVGVSN